VGGARRSRAFEQPHRALDVERIAETGIGVDDAGQPRHLHHVGHAVHEFGECQVAHVGIAEAPTDAATGAEHRIESGFLHQQRTQPVIGAGGDDNLLTAEQFAEFSSISHDIAFIAKAEIYLYQFLYIGRCVRSLQSPVDSLNANVKPNRMSTSPLAPRHIFVPALPRMRARISHAVVFGDTVTVSGMVGRDPVTGNALTGVAAQTRQVLDYLGLVLAEAGSGFDCVAKTGCFLRSMADFDAFNAVWESYFPDNPPARICVQAELGPGFDVEIDAIAWVRR